MSLAAARRWPSRAVARAGLWLAALALAFQLGSGAAVPDLGAVRALDALQAQLALSICHSGPATPLPAHRHDPACALCIICQAMAAPGLLPLPGAPALPERIAGRVPLAPLPSAAAPPARIALGFLARGPPAAG